jgi:HEPN domain-containing protein
MKSDADHALGWIAKADSDLKALRVLLDADLPHDTACFHAQQAAEKYLKAVLAASGRAIVKTHVLLDLLVIVKELHPQFEAHSVELATLTKYATSSRYRLDFWPDRAMTEAALVMAERVRRAVIDVLPPGACPGTEGETS